MKLKWGALAVDGRGKIGGQVAARNRSGAYLRNKVTPNNPNTGFQSAIRSLLSQLSAQWRKLTQEQRDAWNAAVTEWSKTNVFGDTVNPTGKNLFTQLNIVNLNLGGTGLEAPPTKGSPAQIDNLELSIDAGSPKEGEAAWDVIEGSGEGILYATAPQSPGTSYVERKYRRLMNIDDITSGNQSFYSEYVDRFGLPAEGQKVFVKVVPAIADKGQKGVGITASTIVQLTP
jgi:hypothetical protein